MKKIGSRTINRFQRKMYKVDNQPGFHEYAFNESHSCTVYVDLREVCHIYLFPTVIFCRLDGWSILTFRALNFGFRIGIYF